MQEYDVALKSLLRGSAKLAIQDLTGVTVEKWLDVELPKVQNLRLDLLAEASDGSLIHLELQSTNDPLMPLRMAEYGLSIFRQYGRFARQLLIYVGEAPLKMASKLNGPDVLFRYTTIDIRNLDGERLLESPEVGDNIIAILARLEDDKEAVHRIVTRIAGLGAVAERESALRQLLVIAGLRRLEVTIEQEANKMPILNDILDHKVLGREFKRGRQEGIEEGLQQGVQQGELALLRRMVEKRFGSLPSWAEEKLAGRTTPELEELGIRLLDAQSLEELLKTNS